MEDDFEPRYLNYFYQTRTSERGRFPRCRKCLKIIGWGEESIFFMTTSELVRGFLKMTTTSPHHVSWVTLCMKCWENHKRRLDELEGTGYS